MCIYICKTIEMITYELLDYLSMSISFDSETKTVSFKYYILNEQTKEQSNFTLNIFN